MDDLQDIDYTVPGFGEFYDELPLWSAPFGRMLLDRVPLAPHLRILDVGAGTGFTSLELAQRCGSQALVIAVDPWISGLDRLRRKVDYLGLGNIRVIEGDAADLDLDESSIDVVVSNLGINNFADPDAVLRECFRVARPRARLLFTSNLVGHMQELYDVYRQTLIELGQHHRLPLLDAHIAHRGTVESHAETIERAGFRLLEVARDSFRLRYASGSSLMRHFFIRLGFVAAWREIAAPGSQAETLQALEQNLDRLADDRGELALTIPAACFEAEKGS